MGAFRDLTGQRFGRLTVLERSTSKMRNNGKTKTVWKCQCDCGKVKDILAESLRSGRTVSCGCYNNEKAGKNFITHGYSRGYKKERLYYVWRNMIERCDNSKMKEFLYYGGRGISVCDEWRNYAMFRAWAYANGYDETAKPHQCTIDRINNDGNYEPNNCRWVDAKAQSLNRSDNRLITFNGVTKPVVLWATEVGLSSQLLYSRLHKGWSVERTLTTPKRLLATGKGKG